MSNAGAVFNWLNGPHLVIGMHDAHEDRARHDRAAKVGWINAAGAVDGQIGDLRAQAFEKSAGFDSRRMLDLRRNDVVALVAESEEDAFEGEVIGLTAAACENDLVVLAAKQ